MDLRICAELKRIERITSADLVSVWAHCHRRKSEAIAERHQLFFV